MTPAGMLASAAVLAAAAVVRAALVVQGAAPVRRRVPAVAPPGPGWRSRPVPTGVARRLADCALPLDPAAAWYGWWAGGAAGVAGAALTAGPGGAVVTLAVWGAGPVVAWRLCRHRAAAQLEARLPAAMEAVARGLRSGGSLRQALGEAAAASGGAGSGWLGADLAGVTAACAQGATVVAAVERWAARRPLPGVRLAAAALCLGAETGGADARAVDGVAATLRGRLAADAEVRALATQARASAVVIAVAPVAFAALAAATDARTAAFLFGTPLGVAMLCAGLALDAAGALWMAAITRPAGPA